MKRILALLTALALCLSLAAVPVIPVDGGDQSNPSETQGLPDYEGEGH